jgi:YVTN family beta-propeller protein
MASSAWSWLRDLVSWTCSIPIATLRLARSRWASWHWIAATSDNRFVYVTNEHSDDVSVVDLSAGSVTARIQVGKLLRKIVIQRTPGERLEQARQPPRIVRPGQ